MKLYFNYLLEPNNLPIHNFFGINMIKAYNINQNIKDAIVRGSNKLQNIMYFYVEVKLVLLRINFII